MDDQTILQLYFDRTEAAIVQTDRKYGGYCYSIAYNILTNREDSEESVSDAYLAAWNAIPPKKPTVLSTFLGRLTRNISIDRWRSRNARKRGGGEMPLALDELGECIGTDDVEQKMAWKETALAIRHLLDTLPETERRVFLRRYWYLDSVQAICERYDFTESKVKLMLFRTRKKLHAALQEEGLI